MLCPVSGTMISILFLIWVWTSLGLAQQYYDPSGCSSDANNPVQDIYTCNSSLISQTSCRTFLLYRSNKQFQTLLNISALFETKSDELLQLNNLIDSPSEILKPVPLKGKPNIVNITDSPPPAPGFLPTVTIEKTGNTKLRKLFIAGSVVGFFLVVVLVVLLVCGLYLKALCKWKREQLLSFNGRSSSFSCSTPRSSPRSGQIGRSSATSCFSPDLLAGIKFSLNNYSIEDVRRATKDFSEETKLGKQVHKGLIGNDKVMIRQMKFDDMRRLISGRKDMDGRQFRDSIGFLGGGASEGGCFEQLRIFMDPSLEDYSLAEALCLAVLARACVEDDPLHRPSTDDILKVLGRMIWL
ncbi:hypothetical protein SLEP1_g19975 [Rubroshorea leprosula]|uniref:NFP/LYK4/5 first LysM domain-containing protein n=1 Tax=Rubroshorea leprosula TaxID=152421 RepID=A0AAV5J152_9ROSI|nr:hypothetical protein SLEP1_g19975 [Rubroshorea leprosula]